MQIETAPFDPRFVTTNQAKHCYTRYNEFYKCDIRTPALNPPCCKWPACPLPTHCEVVYRGVVTKCEMSSGRKVTTRQ